MSKIESIIEFRCTDTKPSDCEWSLRKQKVKSIAEDIKKLLLEEVHKAPRTWEDAVEVVKEF